MSEDTFLSILALAGAVIALGFAAMVVAGAFYCVFDVYDTYLKRWKRKDDDEEKP